MAESMSAWALHGCAPAPSRPLRLERRPVPVPADDELLVRVQACGLCRTDLHLVEGDLAPRRDGVVPGHQVVGDVIGTGRSVRGFGSGDRIGIAWLRHTCGECRWCRSGEENLCPAALFTGWDADGGLAEQATVPAAFAYRLPDTLDVADLAPLLCAGIIGYRALRRSHLRPGGRLGIYGFGSSAHITAQVAAASGAEIFVVTRGTRGRALARELGAVWTGDPDQEPPVPLDAAVVFAPAGELVPRALAAVDRGGTVVLAGIHLSDVPALDYQRHLFLEKDLRSVTANTRRDGDELLRLAERIPLRLHVTTFGFDQVGQALEELATDRIAGSAVIRLSPDL